MEGIVDKKLVTYKRNKFVHKWWYRVVIWLAAGAVFITTYFLMLPALTATEDGDPGTTQIVSGNIINDEIQVNNVFPVQAILGDDARYNGKVDYRAYTEEYFKTYDVILIHANTYRGLGHFFYGDSGDDKSWKARGIYVGEQPLPSNLTGLHVDLKDWIGIRIECATKDANASTISYDYHYVSQVSMEDASTERLPNERQNRILNLAHTNNQGFVLMVKKDYMGYNSDHSKRMYWPKCNIEQTYELTEDDKVHVNQTPLKSLGHPTWTSIYDDKGYISIGHDIAKNKGLKALAYITFSPYVDQSADANAAENINGTEDKKVVDNFTFKLFDYDKRINMCKEGKRLESTAVEADLRNIAPYFNFRGGTYSTGNTDPWRNYWIRYAACTCKRGSACNSVLHRNDTWDADGFTKYHATVEYDMRNYEDTTLQGYPMLSFTHDAEGNKRTPTTEIEKLTETSKSLKYLFNGQQAQTFLDLPDGDRDRLAPGSGKVTEYAAKNTILQYNEDTGEYWYDSAQNAVDYDKVNNLFRVRSYRERNELAAAFGLETDDYYDFMPFNYTKGIVSQVFYHDQDEFKHKLNEVSIPFEKVDVKPTISTPAFPPHIASSEPTNANYWFGMTMEFSFIQGKDGTLVHVDSNGNKKPAQDMVFTFSGDDDVWVFIDDVLVLDLGGTHGTVTGSINFSTGEVKQYLDWNKSKETDTDTSFPTTLRKCFDRAGALTRVEWDSDRQNRFADYTTHTLKFYYLERGQAVANCSIRFNLQSFSDKSLVVEKQLDKETSGDPLANEVLSYLQKTQEYKFRVLKDDMTRLLFTEGNTFTKFNTITGETTKGCTVGASGIFTLKHGEQAIFEDMWEKTGSSDSNIEKYYVQELRPNGQKHQYSDEVQYTLGTASGVIRGEDTGTGFQGYMSSIMSPVETQTVKFKNTVMVDTLYDLKINKTIELIDPARIEEYSSKEFSVEVKLDGVPLPVGTKYLVDDTEECTVQTEGIIKIKADETVTIKGIVAGTIYTVKEVFDNGPAGFVAKYPDVTSADGVTDEINANNNNVTITIKNVQCGAVIPLTISKQLVNATDNSNFTFKFSVEQIRKDANENYIVDNSDIIDIIEITISGKEHNGIVTQDVSLKYLAEYFDVVGDTYLYYKIIEATDNGDKVSIIDYDSTAYVVTVKVNKDAAGNLTAEIENIEKFMDGNITNTTQGNYEIESINGLNGSVEFVNTLNLYSLPATGGSGEKFTASQFALGYVLLVGAVVFLMCCFTDKGRRDDSKKDKP